jgi:hypothetical protein
VSDISRDELIRRLAEVSHRTYMRQKLRDHGAPLEEITPEVTDHDRERAEDVVAELERLGVYEGSSSPERLEDRDTPAEPAPPPAESRRERVTDIWGNPITKRRGRRR